MFNVLNHPCFFIVEVKNTVNELYGSFRITYNYLVFCKICPATQQAITRFSNNCSRLVTHLSNHVTCFCYQIKCAQYWPSEGTEQYGDIEVTVTEWIEFANYTITTFQVCKVNKNDLLTYWI